MNEQPTAAFLIIGDEILSGRTKDRNLPYLAEALVARGIRLAEVRIVPDIADEIVAAVQALSGRYTHLFTSGGIGPTHDDITAECVARALGVPIDIREDARQLLEAHYAPRGIALNAARLRMARIPEGACLIENPISAAPGFSIRNVHVMAGVPQIFQAMVDGIVPALAGGPPMLSAQTRIDRPEGEIAAALGRLAEDRPGVRFGCYPFFADGRAGCNVVVRAHDSALLAEAVAAVEALRDAAGPDTAQPTPA